MIDVTSLEHLQFLQHVSSLLSSPLRCARADDTPADRLVCVAYTCPIANVVHDTFEEVPTRTAHLGENAPAQDAPPCSAPRGSTCGRAG